MKKIIISLNIILISFSANSQEKFEWNIKNFTFLDNREYDRDFAKPQTIFGTRLDFTTGFRVDSVHLFQFGADYLYEFGARANAIPLYPTIYYSFSNKHYDFSFGAFPRANKLNYPRLLLNDTLQYYRPNIEGTYVNYKGKYGNQNLWIDWVGRQTDTNNERFLAGTSGKLQDKSFFIENYLYMYHHAAAEIPDTSFQLRDNGGGLFLVGLDFTKKLYFKISFGTAFSYDRFRPNPYIFSKGFYGKFVLEYKRMSVLVSHYQGDAMSLGYGDVLYKTGKYTRLDLEYNFITHKRIKLYIQFSEHFYGGEINMNQKLIFNINLNGTRNAKFFN